MGCIANKVLVEKYVCPNSPKNLSIERVAEAKLPTAWGDFQIAGYRSLTSTEEFVVLYKGELRPDIPTLVRIHSQCLTGDVFGSAKCDCGPQLHRTLKMIEDEGGPWQRAYNGSRKELIYRAPRSLVCTPMFLS